MTLALALALATPAFAKEKASDARIPADLDRALRAELATLMTATGPVVTSWNEQGTSLEALLAAYPGAAYRSPDAEMPAVFMLGADVTPYLPAGWSRVRTTGKPGVTLTQTIVMRVSPYHLVVASTLSRADVKASCTIPSGPIELSLYERDGPDKAAYAPHAFAANAVFEFRRLINAQHVCAVVRARPNKHYRMEFWTPEGRPLDNINVKEVDGSLIRAVELARALDLKEGSK